MRAARLITCLALTLPLLASAQTPELKIPSFEELQHKAVDSVNITIDSTILGLAGHFMPDSDPDSAQLKKTLAGLKSVQVRSFRFDSDFAYSKSDIDSVRTQLAGPGWSRLVQVHDHNKKEDVDVYLALDQHIIKGVAIITSDPRKFTIVNVVGTVAVDQIAQLQKAFATTGEHNASLWAQTP
jgi:Domain of unknown function (DUF4252)